jgi:hypothetical protein
VTTGQDWVEQALRLVESLRAPAGEDASADSSGSCRWCPLCQAAAVVRGARPEVTAALADVLTSTAAALRAFAGEPAAASSSDPGPEPEEAGGPAPEPPAVQRIELG